MGPVKTPTSFPTLLPGISIQVSLQREIPLTALGTNVTAPKTNSLTFGTLGDSSLIVDLLPLHQSVSPQKYQRTVHQCITPKRNQCYQTFEKKSNLKAKKEPKTENNLETGMHFYKITNKLLPLQHFREIQVYVVP